MKILLATDVFPPKSGGSGWSTFYLARALLDKGHTVRVVQPRAGATGVTQRAYGGVPVDEVGYTASTLPGMRAWQRTRALDEVLGNYLAERAPSFDVVHAQHQLTISAAAAARERVDFPLVSTVRDYWAVCLYGTLWRDTGICPVCRGGELTRCLAQKYGSAAKFMSPVVPLVERELKRRQQNLAASDAIIAVSEYVAGTLRDVVTPQKLHVVPNLIDVVGTQRIAQASTVPPMNSSYLIFIGKLNPLKGADLLPRILAESGTALPLVVVGAGDWEEKLRGISRIQVRGWLPNDETLALLARAQALIFPARWAEPLARTLLEAQALGVPTVALNTGGTCDIIERNFNGLLAADVSEFSTHVRRITDDATLRQTLSQNAVRVAETKFSPDRIVSQLETLYLTARSKRAESISHHLN